MLLADADIEAAVREALAEADQAGAVRHGGGDGDQSGLIVGGTKEGFAEDLRERRARPPGGGARYPPLAHSTRRQGVEAARVGVLDAEAAPLLRVEVQDDRPG